MNPLGDLSSYAYYILVYQYLQDEIAKFQQQVVGHMMQWATGMALGLVTLWIMIQGFRLVTGRANGSMMAFVVDAGRVALIVSAATTMSVFGAGLQSYLSANGALGSEISTLVAGSGDPVSQIDENMAAAQLTMAAIDVVQVSPGNTETANEKDRALMMATFGASSPAMAAGAMLLLYQFTMAIFVSFGPIFILCLIFEQTKGLFQRWLFYGISTLFAIAMLDAVSSIVLKLMLNVAGALWAASTINAITGQGAEGFTSQAMQQGGIGLLMTVLIISVPPLAGQFFGGTVGNFLFQSAFGAGGARAAAMQQGLPPGAYGGGGRGYAPPPTGGQSYGQHSGGNQSFGGANPSFDPRLTGSNAAATQGTAQAPTPGAYGQAGRT